MEKQIKKILQNLKEIKPSEEFVKNSRRLILSSQEVSPVLSQAKAKKRINILEGFLLGTSMTLAALLVLILVGGFSAGGEKTALENGQVFNIELGEAEYSSLNLEQLGFALGKLEGEILKMDYTTERNKLLNSIDEVRKLID